MDELLRIQRFCVERNLKIAVAESVTSGLVQAWMSNMPEAGLFFLGGITAYTCESKEKLLDIPLELSRPVNGVASAISDLLAEKVCSLFGAELGLGITGYATLAPDMGVFSKYAFGSLYLSGCIVHRCFLVSHRSSQADVQKDFCTQLIKTCAAVLATMGRNHYEPDEGSNPSKTGYNLR